MPDYQKILYSADGAIGRITLNRPEKRNALDDQIIAELKAALKQADGDGNIRVILLKGAGKDFCSGMDISGLRKMAQASILENIEDAAGLMELFVLPRKLKKPVVAAVQGRALAGGCGLASACDIVLASRSAQFGYSEVKIGFVPAMVMAILRRNVSEKRAFELITRGETISAADAERIGLINRVFDDETFDSEVDSYAAHFSNVSASAVALTKYLFYHIDGMNFDTSIRTGVDLNAIARMTEDCRRGVEKFLKN